MDPQAASNETGDWVVVVVEPPIEAGQFCDYSWDVDSDENVAVCELWFADEQAAWDAYERLCSVAERAERDVAVEVVVREPAIRKRYEPTLSDVIDKISAAVDAEIAYRAACDPDDVMPSWGRGEPGWDLRHRLPPREPAHHGAASNVTPFRPR